MRPETKRSGAWAAGTSLEDLPDGVLVVNSQGLIVDVNHAFLELATRKRADVVGHAMQDMIAEEDILQILGFDAVFGAELSRDTNVIFTCGSGERRSLVVNSARSEDGNRTFLTVRAAEIVHEELANTTRWAASQQERADELGRARDALAAKNAALRVAQGELEAAYAKLKSEVATRERLENDLRLAQKLEAIGQLAAGVAHEINTPMQYIGDNVTFLSRSFGKLSDYLAEVSAALEATPENSLESARARVLATQKKLRLPFLMEQVPKALTASQEGIENVSNIVRAMKSFARVDQGEKAQADLNQALRDTLIVAQNEYKNVASIETDFGELPHVTCFIGRLNQVFLNLIVNAAHAIADANRTSLGKIRVISRCEAGVVEIRIADNGSGIDSSIRHRIFEQFFTTKEVGRGTGQGLSIARNIVVEVHGGTLDFESEVGAGTVFCVRLPVDGEAKLEAAAAPSLET